MKMRKRIFKKNYKLFKKYKNNIIKRVGNL